MKEDILKWLGPERCTKLKEQTEGRFEIYLEGISKIAIAAPTGALLLLQRCGSQPTPEDTKRWHADVYKIKSADPRKPRQPKA